MTVTTVCSVLVDNFVLTSTAATLDVVVATVTPVAPLMPAVTLIVAIEPSLLVTVTVAELLMMLLIM